MNRPEKRQLQDTKSQIRDIEKTAGKEIRKNRKIREKEEKRAASKGGFFARFKKRRKQPNEAEPASEEKLLL